MIKFEEIHNTNDLIQKLFENHGTFLEIHSLRSYAAVLLNRDDNGDAKTAYIGGTKRTIISSQCKKSAIRQDCIESRSSRTRRAPEGIVSYICETYDIDDLHKDAYLKIAYKLLSEKDFDEKNSDNYMTSTIISIGKEDIQRIGNSIVKYFPVEKNIEFKKNKSTYLITDSDSYESLLKELKEVVDASKVDYDICLFGRMSTCDVVSSEDSAAWYNFGYSTNKNHNDSDFFVAQDVYAQATSLFTNLNTEPGAGHLNIRDINADTFYDYAGFSLNAYIENVMKGVDFENKDAIKERLKSAVDYFCEAVEKTITVVPTAMQHQMASFPDPVVYVTLKENARNTTFDDAFELAVEDGNDSSVMTESVKRLVESIKDSPFETGKVIGKYWISKKKYSELADIEGVKKVILQDLLADIKGYLYGKIGIED